MDKEIAVEHTAPEAAAGKLDALMRDDEAGPGAVSMARIDKVYR